MDEIERLLDAVYAGQERLERDEIVRHAVAAGAAATTVDALETLPPGDYAYDEALDALAGLGAQDRADAAPPGVRAEALSDDDLSRELAHLHETRDETFRHGPARALEHHDQRTAELEAEWVRRYPDRAVEPRRLRDGAREPDIHDLPPDGV
ncbi:DUF6158 family protein [Dactylosporangium salmoneum]